MDNGKIKHLQTEDKRKMCFVFLEKACEDFPQYSAGEILYTALRKIARRHGQSASFLRGIKDNELFKEFDLRFFEEKGV